MKINSGSQNRIWLVRLCAIVLAACGGGGGGGGPTSNPPPPAPQPKTISGVVLLGPVANADVEVVGTSGSLGTGTTDANGRFGPISYSGSYDGPLRITVTGTANSTWVCDYHLGCAAEGLHVPVGDTLTYDGTLEAVLADASDDQYVSVSMLSDIVSKRLNILGDLTAANVETAYSDIATTIRSIFGDTFASVSVSLPDNFASVPLFDPLNLPEPGSSSDALSLVLSYVNSVFVRIHDPLATTGDSVAAISEAFARQPDLPVASIDVLQPSRAILLGSFFFQVQAVAVNTDFDSVAADSLLSPANLLDLYNAATATFDVLPALQLPQATLSFVVDEASVQTDIVTELPVQTTTGELLQEGAYEVLVANIGTGGDWLGGETFIRDDIPYIRVVLDNAVLQSLPNDSYNEVLLVYSTSGEYRLTGLEVDIEVRLFEYSAFAGDDIAAIERSSVTLGGATNAPDDVETVSWTQLSGPAVTINAADTFEPVVDLPGVDADATVTLQLSVEFAGGQSRTDVIDIAIDAYPNVGDLTFTDPVLQQCIVDTASADGYSDAGEFVNLSCSGISSVEDLAQLPNLVSLSLPDNQLSSLTSLIAMTNLQFLDLSGNETLHCDDVDILAQRLDEGTNLIVSDLCVDALAIELGAIGFDTHLDSARDQLYVSIPSRREIAVVSLADLRIVDRLSLPGEPNGIDLSIDGTRLFAALNGNNAVAVVEIEQRTVTSIDLGAEPAHPTTYDVVEGAPDRLFVSANPGSGGFAYITQVRLDQGNAASRVANQNIIRARPTFARAPDQQFVYVGSGFSPNSLYKLSLIDPDAPIVLEDDHGSVGGTQNLTLNAAGTRIALASGQVLRTSSFIEEGRVTAGSSVAASSSDSLIVAGSAGRIESFDFATLQAIDSLDTRCDYATTSRIVSFDNDDSFVLLQLDTACVYTTVSRSAPPDPFAALRMADLALEECVIETAMNEGLSRPRISHHWIAAPARARFSASRAWSALLACSR